MLFISQSFLVCTCLWGAHSPLPSEGPPGFGAGEAPEALTHRARALLFRTLNLSAFYQQRFSLKLFLVKRTVITYLIKIYANR